MAPGLGLQDNRGLATFTYRQTGQAVSSDELLCLTAVISLAKTLHLLLLLLLLLLSFC